MRGRRGGGEGGEGMQVMWEMTMMKPHHHISDSCLATGANTQSVCIRVFVEGGGDRGYIRGGGCA